jgi:hypothetical protein
MAFSKQFRRTSLAMFSYKRAAFANEKHFRPALEQIFANGAGHVPDKHRVWQDQDPMAYWGLWEPQLSQNSSKPEMLIMVF